MTVPALRFSLLTVFTIMLPAVLGLIEGCGTVGAPQPPSLKVPTIVADLSASRTGSEVHLHWTMPKRTTDKVLLVGDQRVSICRNEHPGRCARIGGVLLQPSAAADYTDALPPALASGGPRLLTYTVELTNRSSHAAGPSNPAYAAAGAAPPEPEQVSAEATDRGIVLRWAPVSAPVTLIRLHRSRLLGPGESPKPGSDETRAGVPQPLEQTLELLPRGEAPDHVIDADALLDRRYRYQVQRVERITLAGHTVEVSSAPGAADILARDTFPPAVPQGLAAVADNDAKAIDLSWNQDSDLDLAGYVVYRRAPDEREMVRVSGAAPVDAPAWRDAKVEPGVRYAYAISAVDRDGNESARSPETTEGLAAQP